MIKDLYQSGVSISAIARLTGHDRKTVRSAVNQPLQVTVVPRKCRASKLDPFAAYLDQRIAAGVTNAAKLHAELRTQGYAGGQSLVKAYVQPHRHPRPPQATVRFETAPGQQAQADWGYFGYLEQDGRRRRLYAFIMTLGWSRMMYLEFTVSTDIASWLRCHMHAFEYFGGAPRQVLHDNLKTAVLDRHPDGSIHWHPRYLDFAQHYGFSPQPCRPYRAQTKGKVERGVRYVRGNFWPGLQFSDLADLNQQARVWLDTVANVRVHGTTGLVPAQCLPDEHLDSLHGRPPYDTSLVVFRRSSADCLVSYDGNYYSVPAEQARRLLTLKVQADGQLLILNAQDALVAQHTLLAAHHQRSVVPAHYDSLQPAARAERGQPPAATPVAYRWPDAPTVEMRPLTDYAQHVEAAA